jgi:hypothetical protein
MSPTSLKSSTRGKFATYGAELSTQVCGYALVKCEEAVFRPEA